MENARFRSLGFVIVGVLVASSAGCRFPSGNVHERNGSEGGVHDGHAAPVVPETMFSGLYRVFQEGGTFDVDGDGVNDYVVEVDGDSRTIERWEGGRVVSVMMEHDGKSRTEKDADGDGVLEYLEMTVEEDGVFKTYRYEDFDGDGRFDQRIAEWYSLEEGFCLRAEKFGTAGWEIFSDYCAHEIR